MNGSAIIGKCPSPMEVNAGQIQGGTGTVKRCASLVLFILDIGEGETA